jgi:hypothetical protein
MTRIALRLLACAAAGLLAAQAAEAHKKVTSRFNYNDHVFPIFRDRCSRCHVKNGVAPMSLVTYQDAIPWAESLRLELLATQLEGESAAPEPLTKESFVKVAHKRLTPREVDTILEWATGGTPQGDLEQKLPVVTLYNDWSLGAPDAAVQMPAAVVLDADETERTERVVLPVPVTRQRTLKTIDVVPGNPSLLREMVVCLHTSTDAPGCTPGAPGALGTWHPGFGAVPVKDGRGVDLPPHAELVLALRYKKTWQYDGQQVSDRSAIGLYFAERTTRAR